MKGLWWLAPSLNRRLCDIGKGAIVAQDSRHQVATNVLIDHTWTEQDKADFLDHHRLPVSPYAAHQRDNIAVPLEFTDLSVSTRGTHLYPLYMREAYWLRPADKQKTIILGSPTLAPIIQDAKVTAAYAMIPSGITTKHEQGLRDPNEEVEPAVGTGLQYFIREGCQKDDALPDPPFSTTATQVRELKQGSAFFNDEDYNPLRSILSEDVIAHLLVELISGPDDEVMTIQNPQTRVAGPEITKGDYRTTMAALNQAACTQGCKTSLPCLRGASLVS